MKKIISGVLSAVMLTRFCVPAMTAEISQTLRSREIMQIRHNKP